MLKLGFTHGKLVMLFVIALAIFLFAGVSFAGNHSRHNGQSLSYDTDVTQTQGNHKGYHFSQEKVHHSGSANLGYKHNAGHWNQSKGDYDNYTGSHRGNRSDHRNYGHE
jgi:hypothetical protein